MPLVSWTHRHTKNPRAPRISRRSHRRRRGVAQPRERHGDHPVGHPLARGGQAQRGRPDAVGEHLAEQHPHHRSPRHAERHHEQVGGDQGDRTGSARRPRTGSPSALALVLPRRITAIVPSVTAMPIEPTSSSGLRPTLSISAIAISVVSDVGDRRDHRDDKRRASRVNPTASQSTLRVVEDHVDADELLEYRQAQADPDNSVDAHRSACADRSTTAAFRLSAIPGSA